MGEVVVSGFLPLALLVAALAGFVSFASPCILPLIPGYLAVFGNWGGSKNPIWPTLIFVLSFTAIFASFGLAFGQLGSYLVEYQSWLNRVFGVLLIAMGLIFAGITKFSQYQFKLPLQSAQPVVLGIVFAVGWTPCIGPTLAAVQTLALTQATAIKGALLSISYGVGLGLPFILLSAFATKSSWITKQLHNYQRTFMVLGSGFLIVLGVLLITGLWSDLMIWLQQQYAGFVVPL